MGADFDLWPKGIFYGRAQTLIRRGRSQWWNDKGIQLEIFHYYGRNKSCIPLCGTNARNPKQPKNGFLEWQIGCVEWLKLNDYATDMIGLCTGLFNNIFVLDVDNVEIFQKVVDYFNLSLPETTLMKSVRGFHHYFSYPEDFRVYSSRGFHYLGFDILASGKYVVAPGSFHPNGDYYKPVRLLKQNHLPPEWLKSLSAQDGELNFILSQINKIGISDANKAKKLGLPEPEFDIDKLVARVINDNPQYENFMHQFPGYNKSLENTMMEINYNPIPSEQTHNTSIELSESTKNALNYNPPIGQRSEPIMSAILALKNAGLSDEQVKQIMLSSPLGAKLSKKGEQFTSYEIASANSFIQANPPKKPKIDIAAEAYAYMQQFHYVRVGERELYCKVIHSLAVIEYIDVKSDSFQGIICKYLLANFKKIIPAVQFKPLLAALIEDKRFTAPIVQSISRFYSDDSKIIYDLGRDDYQCIEITANCVRQIPHPEMILERSNLTIPVTVENSLEKSGNIALLWDLCDIRNDYERHFLNIVVLSYLFNNISSPILYFYGSHGSGKTNLALAIKNIFDPAEEGTVLPSRDSALRLFLNKSGIGLIDNFSKLNSEFQNDLCSSYSGGKTIERELYSNKGTVQYSIKCPIILTSINVPTKLQPDFISRTVFSK